MEERQAGIFDKDEAEFFDWLSRNADDVIHGVGEPDLEDLFRRLAAVYGVEISVDIGVSEPHSHLKFSGGIAHRL